MGVKAADLDAGWEGKMAGEVGRERDRGAWMAFIKKFYKGKRRRKRLIPAPSEAAITAWVLRTTWRIIYKKERL